MDMQDVGWPEPADVVDVNECILSLLAIFLRLSILSTFITHGVYNILR